MHNGFLNVEGEKMSKSLGNFFTVRDLLDRGIPGEVMRFVLLSTHYRQPMDWTEAKVHEATVLLTLWEKLLRDVRRVGLTAPAGAARRRRCVEALADDLNTPLALKALRDLASRGEARRRRAAARRSGEFVASLDLMGISPDGFRSSGDPAIARAGVRRAAGRRTASTRRVAALLTQREEARAARDFRRADAIRDGLVAAGIKVMDRPGGASEWELGPDFDPAKLDGIGGMTRERLFLYDTTLRDGQQSQGVDFSVEDKVADRPRRSTGSGSTTSRAAGPGRTRPTAPSSRRRRRLARARLTAFGMTKRARAVGGERRRAGGGGERRHAGGVPGRQDARLPRARPRSGSARGEPRQHRASRWRTSSALGREALFDAEHFFDGWRANPDYALACLRAALDAGARWVVLCDTNGGTLPAEVGAVTAAVVAAGIPGERLGIHTHDDTGNAVANALAAVDAGARQVQGTLNGLGERCGNANLVSLIPTLLLKEPYASRGSRPASSAAALPALTRVSRLLDDILNRVPDRRRPTSAPRPSPTRRGCTRARS